MQVSEFRADAALSNPLYHAEAFLMSILGAWRAPAGRLACHEITHEPKRVSYLRECCRLLTKDTKKRPEAAQALTHPWLKVSSKSGDGYDPYLQAISDEVASNLAKFAASNKLQRAFMHLAVSFLHKNEMQKMLSMFNRLNTDHHTPLPAQQMTELLAKGRTKEEAEQFRKTVEVQCVRALRPVLRFYCALPT